MAGLFVERGCCYLQCSVTRACVTSKKKGSTFKTNIWIAHTHTNAGTKTHPQAHAAFFQCRLVLSLQNYSWLTFPNREEDIRHPNLYSSSLLLSWRPITERELCRYWFTCLVCTPSFSPHYTNKQIHKEYKLAGFFPQNQNTVFRLQVSK